ncbi:MAG: glycosyltransferase, partial [Phycisphaerales bacterium]
MRLLHLIPRFIGGGPERDLLALIAAWRTAGVASEHEVLVLDPPISAPLLLRARRFGVPVHRRSDDAMLDDAIDRADLVSIDYWNHPALLDTMRRPWPAARVLVRTAIRGTTRPHVATAELGTFADRLLASSPRTLATPAVEAVRAHGGDAEWSPALADMSRLDGYRPRPHEGVRIGHVGLIGDAKLHPRFAELCAAVRRRDVGFDVYGPGRLDELRSRFEELGLAERAIVHGPTEDLASAFAGLDAIGHPLAPGGSTTSEKSVQEAMWAGLPVVVLAETGADDLIEHEVTGLVAAHEDDYPRQLERLVDDADLRETSRHGRRCRHELAQRRRTERQGRGIRHRRQVAPMDRRGLVDGRLDVFADRGAERRFHAGLHRQRVDQRREHVRIAGIQHFIKGAALGL